MEEWHSPHVPEGVRRPWQVLEDDLAEKRSQAQEANQRCRNTNPDALEGLRAARRLQKTVNARGAHAAFLDLPANARHTYEKVSLMELAAFAQWRAQRCNARTRAQHERGLPERPESEEVMSRAWSNLNNGDKSDWVPPDAVTALAAADPDGRWGPLLHAYGAHAEAAGGSFPSGAVGRPNRMVSPGLGPAQGYPHAAGVAPARLPPQAVAAPRGSPQLGASRPGGAGASYAGVAQGPPIRWMTDGRCAFTYKDVTTGQTSSFSVSLRSCRSKREAEHVCRLCWDKLQAGATKQDLVNYRNALYEQLAGGRPAAEGYRGDGFGDEGEEEDLMDEGGESEVEGYAVGQGAATAVRPNAAAVRGQRKPQAAMPPQYITQAAPPSAAKRGTKRDGQFQGGLAPSRGRPRGGRGRGRGSGGRGAPGQTGRGALPSPNTDALEAVCCICGSGEATDDNDLALCDRCNRGFHQRCHTPPIVSFGGPDEDWFCGECRAAMGSQSR